MYGDVFVFAEAVEEILVLVEVEIGVESDGLILAWRECQGYFV